MTVASIMLARAADLRETVATLRGDASRCAASWNARGSLTETQAYTLGKLTGLIYRAADEADELERAVKSGWADRMDAMLAEEARPESIEAAVLEHVESVS